MRARVVALLGAALALGAACSDDPAPAQEPKAESSSSPASPEPTTTSPAPKPEPQPRITLTVVGDLMLVRGVPDAAAALAPLSKRLRSADITVGNLESTLSLNGQPTQGGDSFGGTPALLRPLRGAGFDALSLANNHTGDYGSTALVETVRAFDGSGIEGFGAGAHLGEASNPVVLEREGVRFAFVGFNAIGETPRATPRDPGALSVRMPPRTGPLVPADLDRVASAVSRAALSADVVVVLPHWGTQYTHTPEPIQSTVAKRLVAAGADLVVGGHPHWVQSAERISGVPVLHSLGNFVFDMDFMTETMEGVFLETVWRGDKLVRTRLVPYRMDPVTFAPSEVHGAEAARILSDIRIPAPAP
jgi:poly-gamma-glutamate capsule biosynthesis protein CapA/YwtB (metallophosphatase superfamily)